jgi:hypothetical protein
MSGGPTFREQISPAYEQYFDAFFADHRVIRSAAR